MLLRIIKRKTNTSVHNLIGVDKKEIQSLCFCYCCYAVDINQTCDRFIVETKNWDSGMGKFHWIIVPNNMLCLAILKANETVTNT